MSVNLMADPGDEHQDNGVEYVVEPALLDVLAMQPSRRVAVETLLRTQEYGSCAARLRQSGQHWILEFNLHPSWNASPAGFDRTFDSDKPSIILSQHPDELTRDTESKMAAGFRRLNSAEFDCAFDYVNRTHQRLVIAVNGVPKRLANREAFMLQFDDGSVADLTVLLTWGLYARVVKE